MRLVEETEAHVLVRLLLLLRLSRGSLSGATGSSTAGSSSTTTGATRWDGGKLGGTLSDQLQNVSGYSSKVLANCRCGVTYLVDVLALELGDELVKALAISLNADGLKDLLLWCQLCSQRPCEYADLDVAGRGRGVATEAEEKVCRKVLHFDGL
jgi:hypothetical protein